ncbi:hypothetical protein TrCOL_g8039 [Triparma columacea]|uniref:PA domain-containing protein n=1 Tax=Triparma columacea TaxID=722753 RepID=A0A9W7FWX2_9STRA|nr:hypothetical protein TrCOL_g8039 [Triparma columacea]
MRSSLFIVVVFLVLSQCFAIFKKKKVAETFEDVLKEAGLNRKYKSAFLKNGWDSTPQALRRLSKMDLQGIGMSEKEMKKMFASIEKMVPVLEKKVKSKKIDKDLELRKTLNYGRLYVDGAVGSFPFMKANFGGDIPLKAFEIVFGGNGCKEVNNAAGVMLVVTRGECTYLQKAEAAEESGASILVVVNSDNGDLFSLPAGHDLTPEQLDDLPVIPTVLVQQSALKMLQMLEDIDPFAKGMLIPQHCTADGCLPVLRSDRSFLSHFDSSGGLLHVQGLDGDEVKMEFVASNFGITVPDEGELVISEPLDACGSVTQTSGSAMKGKAVIVRRGGCSFYEKVLTVQRHGARVAIMVDNEEAGALDRVGVTTEQLGEIYLPVLMVSRGKGYEMIEKVKERDSESLPSIVYVSRQGDVGVKWEELRNFFANCLGEEDGDKKEIDAVQCNRDYGMLMESSKGNPDREASLGRYKIVDVSHVDEGGGGGEEEEDKVTGGGEGGGEGGGASEEL